MSDENATETSQAGGRGGRMSDAKLWIDKAGFTATIAGTNVSYTMPLWVFNVMRDIIGAEAEKKVEVTHRDFDTQQELLDRHKVENAKLRGWMLDALTVITNLECLVHTMQAQKEWTDEEAEFVEGTLSNNEFMTLDDLARELGVEL